MKRTLSISLPLVLAVLLNIAAVNVGQAASLHVESVASQRTAAPGNTMEASVYVVVQNNMGLVSGLTLKNFNLHAEQVGAGGAIIKPVRVYSGRKGVYRIDLVPGVKGATWKTGDYVISTSVTTGKNEGASVTVMPVK